MRVLITGGAGFLGSHLADRLIADGNEVWVVDDLSTGSFSNVEHLKDHPGFHFTCDTILNAGALVDIVDWCDTVVHLAAAVGVRLIIERPVHTIETNVRGTEVVLAVAAEKLRPVLVASTSEVYGKSERVPFREDDDLVLGPTVKARWGYACSKAMDEYLAFAYWKERALPVTIARLFNIVGPRQTGRYGMVLPRFVQQALECRPITIYGDGRQSRSFTYVADAVEAIVRLMGLPEAAGEVFNVGNDTEITIEELAWLIRSRTGSRSEILHIPYDQAYEKGFEDMQRRVPDVSKLHRVTGFRPTTPLEETIDRIAGHLMIAAAVR